MRLIDADAIVFTHAIARSIDDGHNWNELCVTKDEIDDIPSAEPERKWIPFDAGVPRDYQKVLCTDTKGNMMVGTYMSEYGMGFPAYFDVPVAWMPLPEPYRGR